MYRGRSSNSATTTTTAAALAPTGCRTSSQQACFITHMSADNNDLEPGDMFRPPINRAMRVLDRSFFHRDVALAAACVQDPKTISAIRSALEKSKDILSQRMIAPVRPDPLSNAKCVLLNPTHRPSDESSWGALVRDLQDQGRISIILYTLSLNYDYWTALDILQAIIPEELHDDLPHRFNPVGHIAHFNLRERYLPFKQLIADITLDKNPNVRTVINKTEILGEENEFRVLEFEHLAGDREYQVEHREHGCTFSFDYSKVFWNSKLETEHHILSERFQPGEVVCDVMCGVGPFAVPAGKRGAFVWANDLNPDCLDGLTRSIKFNKVQQFVKPFCSDGRAFIKTSAQDLAQTEYRAKVPIKQSRSQLKELAKLGKDPGLLYNEVPSPRVFSHYVMNLPALAIEFLDAFIGVYKGLEHLYAPADGSLRLPMVHCYCFGPKVEDEARDRHYAETEICKQVSQRIRYPIKPGDAELNIRDVRDVAPNKQEVCVSFRLPAAVAFDTL